MKLYIDGACSGNPGPAAAAWLVVDGNKVLLEGSEYLDNSTNNVAEYTAIIRGMEACIDRGYVNIQVFSDSQLCIRQINGEYRVKKKHLKPLHERVLYLKDRFSLIEFIWIEREDEWIARCDEMARSLIKDHGDE
jgi:ribonuclease HI